MSDSTDYVRLFVAGTFLVLLIGSLASRRVPMGQMARMALGWIGVFGLLFVAFSFRGPLGEVWKQVTREFGSAEESGSGGIVRIVRDDRGHFVARAQVNGRDVRMLIDTGATSTVFPESMARELGIEVDKSGFPTMSSTANGPVQNWRARVGSIRIGGIGREDFPVSVTEGDLDEALLGMSWLDTLKSWRVEGSEMVLEP